MSLIITSSDTLETIKRNSACPPFLFQILDSTTTLQERVENSLLTSLRAKTSFAEWIAALLALNPKATLNNGKSLSLAEVLADDSVSIKDLVKLDISLEEGDLASFEKVANTPGDHSIVSVYVYLKFSAGKISQARIVATGVSKSAYDQAVCSKFLIGKALDKTIVQEFREMMRAEFTPAETYLASSTYRKEMVAVLVEKILLNKINGEI
jgi:CO/xanthine dehydrogenase FAD-binding subunit